MKSLRTLSLCGLTLLALCPAALADTPLPSDSRIVKGRLANGLTWMYREHNNPPGKMAMMMHVRSGSLNETDSQRGLAHFMEHMAFNGTKHFAPGELVKYFESIGMQFGADLNAFTSFDQTAYILSLPNVDEDTLDKALTVLSDYAFRCLLLPEEIDKERGIILEEKRARLSAQQRVMEALWPQLFAGSRFAERIPIGTEEVISKAPPAEFVDYYRTWYRPENITLIAVGDTPVTRVAPLIEKWFSDYKPESSPREPLRADFKDFTQERAIIVTDPDLGSADVTMTALRPGRPPVTTVEQMRRRFVEDLGNWIVDRRLEERVKTGKASYDRANVDTDDMFQEKVVVDASVTGEPSAWGAMLEEMIIEVNRAREHGFAQQELELAKTEFLSRAERRVETEPTAAAQQLVRQILRAVNDREPVLSAQQNLDQVKALLPTIQLSEVNQTFAANFAPGAFAYVLTAPEKPDVKLPTLEELLAAAKEAQARKTEALAQVERPKELMTELPAPGKAVETSKDDDLGVTHAWLENGARVHHRYMDYKKDSVWVSITLAGGQIEETAQNAGISQVAALVFDQPATSRLDSTTIKDIMTGRNVNVGGGAGGDTIVIRVNGSPRDLEEGLKLAHLLLTDGKIEESAFNVWKQRTLQRLSMMVKMPQYRAFEAMLDLTSGGDPKRMLITPERIEAQSLSAGQAWFDRLRREAPIEVAVVGDLPLETAMPLIERYIGSLPQRSRSADKLDALRKTKRSPGPLEKSLAIETQTPQGMILSGFIGCQAVDVADRRALELAREILTSRLIKRIREEAAIVYSIRAQNQAAEVYEDSGMFTTGAPCDPGNTSRVHEEVDKIFAAFKESGPTDDELANARKQIANDLDTETKEPSFWLGVLQDLDLHKRSLDEYKNMVEAINAISADQIRTVFGKYYKPERIVRVSVTPRGGAEAPQADAAAKPETAQPAGAGK